MINFLEVEDTVKNLKQQAETGTIDQETLEAQLLTLVDVGSDGFYWMFGHKTGRWYRHNGQEWVADSPEELIIATHNHNRHNNLPDHASAQTTIIHWDSVDFSWFLIGLVAIGAVFTVIYASAL